MIDDLREQEKNKYQVGEFMDNSLWLADDATLIADSLPNLLELLKILKETGKKNGLEINTVFFRTTVSCNQLTHPPLCNLHFIVQ